MVDDFDYLSIADFAASIGVTKQAVYKRIDKDLLPFSKVINGKKCISIAAAELFNQKTQELTQGEPGESTDERQDKEIVSYLMMQLEEKEKLIQQQQATISEQSSQIKELHQHIMTQSSAITDILQKQSQLQENFQILLGRQQQMIEAASTVEKTEDVDQLVEQPTGQIVEITSSEQEQKENKGMFRRFFNWLK